MLHRAIHDLHMATCEELGLDPLSKLEVKQLLNELDQLLIGICIMQDLTARAKDSLVSFGERLSEWVMESGYTGCDCCTHCIALATWSTTLKC